MNAKDSEDWSLKDLVRVQKMADTTLAEAQRCDQAGAPLGALMLLAVSFEAVLLTHLVTYLIDHKAELPHARWTAQPSRLSLGDLAERAVEMGWLSASDKTKLDTILTPVRNMVAHPGAHLRGLRNAPDLDLGDPTGYQAVLGIVVDLAGARKPPTAEGAVGVDG
jgi:hypothetical protein